MSQTSVAPKERINISYRPSVSSQEEKELPLKLLVLANINPSTRTPLHERKPLRITKGNLDKVLEKQSISLRLELPNRLNKEQETLSVNFNPKALKDFEPDALVNAVPELKQLIKLRSALVALKGPLGNSPSFRRELQQILQSPNEKAELIKALASKEN